MKSESSATYIFSKGEGGVWSVLAARRKDKGDDEFGGLWNVPIGGREEGESTLDTAVRETKEESGIEIPKSKFVSVGDSCYFENGEKHMFSNFVVIMDEKVTPGKGDGENSKFKWIPMTEIDKHKWAFGMENTVKNVFKFIVKDMEKNEKEQLNEYLDKNYMMPLKRFMNMTDEEKAFECAGICPWLLTDFIESSKMADDVDELIQKGELPEDLYELDAWEIGEYLGPLFETKLASYAEDFVRYVSYYGDTEIPLFCVADFVKEIHNEWLIHMTDNLVGLNHEGFSYGVGIDELAYTPGRGTIKYKYGAGYNFGFELRDISTAESSGYGKYCILFQASGVEIYHYGDEQRQVIFYGPSAKNLIFICRADYGEYSGMWCVLDAMDSGYGKYLCHFDTLEKAVYWAIKNFPQYRNRLIGKAQQKNFERNRQKPKEQRWWLSESKGKTIVLTENQIKMLNEKMDISSDAFNSNIRYFLHQLMSDPVNAQPPTALKAVGITRSKLINLLIKKGIIEKHEKLNDKDKDGNYKTATMKVSFTVKDKVPDDLEYRVPKNDFDRKIEKLRREIFEKNVPIKVAQDPTQQGFLDQLNIAKASPLTMGFLAPSGRNTAANALANDAAEVYNQQLSEDGVGGGATSADSSGAFVQPMGGVIRRKIDEEVDELQAKHSTSADFDRFDSSFMGKGCGSQVYGWGHYVTTDKKVQKGYDKHFRNNPSYKIGEIKAHSYTYTVEIPDDTGSNYILWDGAPLQELPYANITETFGDQYNKLAFMSSPKDVSMMLSKMGFIGIKVLPFRNSTSKEKHTAIGSSANYVIFRDEDLKIIDKQDHTQKAENICGYYLIYQGKKSNLFDPKAKKYFFGNENPETWPYLAPNYYNKSLIKITVNKNGVHRENYMDIVSKRLFYPELNAKDWPYMMNIPPCAYPKYYIMCKNSRYIPCRVYTNTPLFGDVDNVNTWAESYNFTEHDNIVCFKNVNGVKDNNFYVNKSGKVSNNERDVMNLGQKITHLKNNMVQKLTDKMNDKFNESTTTTSVGNYQYDVPLGVDKDDETMQRHNGDGGSVSINHM